MPTSLIETAQYEYDTKKLSGGERTSTPIPYDSTTDTQSRLLSAQLGEKLGYLGHSNR